VTAHEQNIFVAVSSSTWTSRPITASQSPRILRTILSAPRTAASPPVMTPPDCDSAASAPPKLGVAVKPIAASSACAASRTRFSLKAGPTN